MLNSPILQDYKHWKNEQYLIRQTWVSLKKIDVQETGLTTILQETGLTTFARTQAGAKLTFTGTDLNDMTEFQTRWWLDFIETLKTRSDTTNLDEICIWIGINLQYKTPDTTGRSSLEELGRCLDDRLTLSDK